MNREELLKLFSSNDENEKVFVCDENGYASACNNYVPTDGEVFSYAKKELMRNLPKFPGKSFLYNEFLAQSVNNFDLNNFKFDIPLASFSGADRSIVVRIKDNNIKIQVIDIHFISPDYYKVLLSDVHVDKLSLSYVKSLPFKLFNRNYVNFVKSKLKSKYLDI